MPIGFHPDIYVAFPADRAIVLDVAADRYRRLDPALSAALRGTLAKAALDAHALEALMRLHILVADAPMRPIALAAVLPAALDVTAFGAVTCAPVRCAAALATARLHLDRRGLARSLAAARRRAATALTDDPAAARDLAQCFARTRRWLPFARRCLPDGIALHAVLSGRGLATRLVIGVRDHPFAAHCWVQAGDTVLSDSLETVAELTPILVL